MWIFAHRRDMESDFSAFHRLRAREVYALDGPEFCALAFRLVAYPGALQARLRMEAERERPHASNGAEAVDATASNLTTHPVLAELFEG